MPIVNRRDFVLFSVGAFQDLLYTPIHPQASAYGHRLPPHPCHSHSESTNCQRRNTGFPEPFSLVVRAPAPPKGDGGVHERRWDERACARRWVCSIRSNATSGSRMSDDERLTFARSCSQGRLRSGEAWGLFDEAQAISNELQNAAKSGKSRSLRAYEVVVRRCSCICKIVELGGFSTL
jgi:hypothetical protein